MPAHESGPFSPLWRMDRMLGFVVALSGKMRENQTSWDDAVAEALLNQCWHLLGEAREEKLEVKSLFFEFPEMLMLGIVHRKTFLIVLMKPGALVSEVEKQARRLIVKAAFHYGAAVSGRVTLAAGAAAAPPPAAPILAASAPPAVAVPVPPPEPKSEPEQTGVRWKEAASQLEVILGKVLAHGQVVRLLETQFAKNGVSSESAVDAALLTKIGSALLEKIKHRALRQTLTREFQTLLDSIH